MFIQMCGLSGAGKSTLARMVAKKLQKEDIRVEIIDGDEYRKNLCSDLGFSKQDRYTNIRRLGFVGRVLARNGVVAIMAAINPYEEIRKEIGAWDPGFCSKTVYIKCDLTELKIRDTKGLYKRACLPDGNPDKVLHFTGISDPFEEPTAPDLTIDTTNIPITDAIDMLYGFIKDNLG